MAVYETGTATDVADLLGKLRTFALANGWSQNYYGARTSGTGNALQINKGGFYVTFRTDTGAGTTQDPGPYIGAYAHGTYSAGNGTENQSGASGVCLSNGMSGPFAAYHFISGAELGSDYLYAIVETTAGTFKHFGTGKMVGVGTLTNGQFVHACRWYYTTAEINASNSAYHTIPFESYAPNLSDANVGWYVRADADTISPRWLVGKGYSYSAATNRHTRAGRLLAGYGFGYGLYTSAASALTARNMLAPCYVAGERAGGLFSPIGYPPGIRWVKLTNLAPNDVLTIGTDQWKVFPVIRKNGTTGQVNSDLAGYAYKVN